MKNRGPVQAIKFSWRKHFTSTSLYRLILKLKSASLIYNCVNRSQLSLRMKLLVDLELTQYLVKPTA